MSDRSDGFGARVDRWLAAGGPSVGDDADLDRLASGVRALAEARDDEGLAPEREAELVRRVLVRTTRQDLGWRGGLQPVLDFLRDRLAASRPLRWVAASLLAHLVALPAVAWYVGQRELPRPARLRVALPVEREPAFDESIERLSPPLPDARGRHLAEVDNRLRRARFRLGGARLDPEPGGVAEPVRDPAGALLAARIAYLRHGHWQAALRLDSTAAPADADRANWANRASRDALLRALRLEVWLDRFVLEGEASAPLALALSDLALLLEQRTELDDAVRRVAELLLARATSYDLWRPVASSTAPELFAPAWFDALRAALDDASARANLEVLEGLARDLAH